MADFLSNDTMARIALGRHVIRAAATLPQTTHSPIFTISGGRVEIVRLVGIVTTIFVSGTNNTKLTSYPTVGSSGDLCTTTDTASLEVGGMITIDGVVGNALVKALAFGIKQMATRLLVPAGTIDLDCSASKTGALQWDCWYIPIDVGASVVAA
jgi:hypothetical protein